MSHHLRFQALVDGMSEAEKQKLAGLLDSVGAEGFTNLQLKRDIKRQNYAYTLA